MTLTATFTALADPTRRAIMTRLSRGEATMGELAAPHDMSLPAITKHVGVLVHAGLVSRRKAGRTVVCTLAPDPLTEVRSWLADLADADDVTGHLDDWNGCFARLTEVLG